MPKYEALANISAGKDLRLSKGQISPEVDESVAAPLVAKGLLKPVSGSTLAPVDPPAGASEEATDVEKKGKGKGKK